VCLTKIGSDQGGVQPKTLLHPKMLYFGTPVVLLSSLNADGTTNVAPMSSAWWVGSTAMLGMSANSQTVRNLVERPRVVLNLVDPGLVEAVDRLALLTGRPDVPPYKQARGYRYAPDKFGAAGLTPVPAARAGEDLDADTEPGVDAETEAWPASVAESLIHLAGVVRAVHEIDEPGSGLRALEVRIERTYVEEDLLLPDHPTYIDPNRWDPLIMKFTEYFGGGTNTYPSSLARGWQMPALPPRVPVQGLRATAQ
jgi:flavin reductase (DIM6/NTAB) family NADH-FMN oxidoreductase RutF